MLANDSDVDSGALTAILVSGPAHGTLTLNPDGSFTFVPEPGYNGTDTFTYSVNDGTTTSAPGTVSITVTAATNTPPVADAKSVQTTINTLVAVTLSGSDADADPLSFVIATPPANGVLGGTPPNMTYTPNPGFSGTDSFTYRANDGKVDSAPATVTITVIPVTANHRTATPSVTPAKF